MTGWAILGVYLAGIIPIWRRAGWMLANWDRDGRRLTGRDVSEGLILGGVAAALWPLVVPIYLLHQLEQSRGVLTSQGQAFFKPPRHVRREAELGEREDRIERLENELGIGTKEGDTDVATATR